MNTFKTPFLVIVAISFLVVATNAQNTPQDYLNSHNTARAQVGVPNVVWDTTLAAYALNYSNFRKADCNLVHSNGPYGENLAKGSGKQCLHYTQVVWRDSVKIGCARVQCTNTWWFVSCNYNSPGNWVGEYPY
ncbi:unnamed protein product [Arabidopsis thaliana]|uniref:(thale cress) hypothetical protein n=1 Tax=Arabidopsis thaliana TaxID=3702 RepID=A0A7G2DWL3_ARATH|nr:unnamed protein product [Arabidopsis thaliana]